MQKKTMPNHFQTLFLSHGGGPLPLLGDEAHQEMIDTLKTITSKLAKPSAIIVISAHWEEDIPTITSGANPELIYDYYGFPKASYEISYPCPGEPDLAAGVQSALKAAGIKAALDEKRGFDHGLFIPLKIMCPQANTPCIQLSLQHNLNPTEHINIGKALAGIEYENLLIIGSGFTFHNMKAFFEAGNEDSVLKNRAFEQWLVDTCSNPDLPEDERRKRLENWADAPHARYCHPREEHLLPLHVCYGVAQAPCREHFEITIMGKKTSLYLW